MTIVVLKRNMYIILKNTTFKNIIKSFQSVGLVKKQIFLLLYSLKRSSLILFDSLLQEMSSEDVKSIFKKFIMTVENI